MNEQQSDLSPADFDDFILGLYFDINPQKGWIHAAIERAYRDTARTIYNLPKDGLERKLWKHDTFDILAKRIEKLLTSNFKDQEEFNLWHQGACISLWFENGELLKVGQGQKIVNMTLKYLFFLGENRVPGISLNYAFFHIPIDNVIQDKLYKKYGIEKLPVAWSTLDYETYHQYQKKVRETLDGIIPMDEEFRLFNEAMREKVVE